MCEHDDAGTRLYQTGAFLLEEKISKIAVQTKDRPFIIIVAAKDIASLAEYPVRNSFLLQNVQYPKQTQLIFRINKLFASPADTKCRPLGQRHPAFHIAIGL